MPMIGIEMAASHDIPDTHSLVTTRRGNTSAVGSPSHRPDPGSMTGICIRKSSRRIPHLYCHVIARRSNMLAVGGPSHSVDRIGMPGIGVHIPTSKSVPYLHRLVTAS